MRTPQPRTRVRGFLDANRTAAGAVDNTATTWSIANLDISTLTDSAADVTKLNSYISGAILAVKEMTDAASSLARSNRSLVFNKVL